jgi:hypothetical protein
VTSRVFLSYAHRDMPAADRIAALLTAGGVEVVQDRAAIAAGDSFVSFMESAVSTSDYCLLLWSAEAAGRGWVEVEWQAALHRSVTEQRAFLVVGRLDEHPVPMLLRPRLSVELHPDPAAGVATLLEAWLADREAEANTARPAGRPPAAEVPTSGEPIYLTSVLFGLTVPWRADLEAPVGVLVDTARQALALPRRVGEDPLEFIVDYDLAVDDDAPALDRSRSLAAQGVRSDAVLWLRTTTRPVAVTAAAAGSAVVFRSGEEKARQGLLRRIGEAGLGPGSDQR